MAAAAGRLQLVTLSSARHVWCFYVICYLLQKVNAIEANLPYTACMNETALSINVLRVQHDRSRHCVAMYESTALRWDCS